ncbi:MAG TPA: methyl-accepting chemotaxis protein, partial [Duganella sp.]|uniref:methyl-accepting chemotaxis protein n=1 Tax=Duganella sp. TaxID=1904440 RepID=UPI002ED5B228
YMIVSVLGHLPKLSESLGQVRAGGAALLSSGEATPEDRVRLDMPMNMARYHAQLAQNAFGKAISADPALEKIIGAPLAAAMTAVGNGLKLANDKIVLAEKPNFPSAGYIAAMTKVIDTQFDLIGVALPALDQALAERVRTKQYELMRTTGWIGALAALVLWIIMLVTRTTVRSMGRAVRVAQTVAAGDLTSRIDVTSNDETGQLLHALKDMNNSLIKIVGEVRGGADTIVSASGQIAADNQDLASRTGEQASALAVTASSMEELTSTVKQNADNARQANDLAASASEVAIKGGAVVSQVVGTMNSINESSKKIVDIIGVIDGIAFQTNILALNAAVEAARAGEQGRGFAVVASEVRNLAQRSAAAAREIKTLIGDSVGKVDTGSKLVDQAGATMDEIVTSIRRVTDIMADITHASEEQHAGIEQVNRAIAQMDKTTQQNAVLVEEAAAAAQSMQHQAGNLVQVVGVFKA